MFVGRTLSLLLVAATVAADQPSFVLIGGTIQLNPEHPASEKINRILWKYNTDLVADWTQGFFQAYGRFKGRTTVDNTTGLLEIRDGAAEDSGTYKVEVNGGLLDLVYQVMVIKKVPKPTVWIRPLGCAPSLISCTLSCDGSIEGAGPINYSWDYGDGSWEQSEKEIVITNQTVNNRTFSCRMENPFGNQESDPKPNPFFLVPMANDSSTTIIVAVIVIVIIIIIIGLGIWYRDRIRSYLSQRGCIPGSQSPAAEAACAVPLTSPVASSAQPGSLPIVCHDENNRMNNVEEMS